MLLLRGTFVTTLFFLLGFTQPCFANLSLSVSPADGSNSLRFERTPIAGVENKQEIHIRVNSTNGNRYQVFQRILEPITNEKGDSLNLQAIQTQTLMNSNSFGSLYLQNSDRMGLGDQLLYSSSQSGAGDSFIIGYSLDQNLINTTGSFRGRLVFTVRGVGNTSSDEMTIDVFLDTFSNLKISVKGAHEPRVIRVQSTDTSDKTADYVNISFSGNSGQEIKVYQEVENYPENQDEEDLGDDVLEIDPQGQTEGLRIQGPNALRNNRTLIYSGSASEDSFSIYFLINPSLVQQLNAGTYRGEIKYEIDSSQGKQEFPIHLNCVILPIFTLNISTPSGAVDFTHVIPNSPPQDKEVVVTVLSNLHKPYQVIQEMQSNMTNQQGKEFDNKYFTVQVEIPSGQKGQTNFAEFSPVQTGQYPVFSSDSAGSGATFTMTYRLQGYAQMDPGDFSAPVILSLNQK